MMKKLRRPFKTWNNKKREEVRKECRNNEDEIKEKQKGECSKKERKVFKDARKKERYLNDVRLVKNWKKRM